MFGGIGHPGLPPGQRNQLFCCLMTPTYSLPAKPGARPAKLVVAALAVATLAGCASAAASGDSDVAAGTTGTTITFNAAQCGGRWRAAPGLRTFRIRNEAGAAAEVYLVNPKTYAVYGALDGIWRGHDQRDGCRISARARTRSAA